MTESQQLGIRFSPELIARIDAHVERLRAEAPWSKPNRATAIRMLVELALDVTERATADSKKKPPRR
jgi:hypothetical protein